MTETQEKTLADLAGEAYEWFGIGERRDSDELIVVLKDGRPEWVFDLVRDAHYGVPDMLMLPDDYRYRAIRDACAFIHETEIDEDDGDSSHEFADGHVDTYTMARYAWLASNLTRECYVDQARDEGLISGDDLTISEMIGVGQYMELREVFGLVLESLTDRLNAVE